MRVLEDIGTPHVLRDRAERYRRLAQQTASSSSVQHLIKLAEELEDQAVRLEEGLYIA
jgi:hypothetical protein